MVLLLTTLPPEELERSIGEVYSPVQISVLQGGNRYRGLKWLGQVHEQMSKLWSARSPDWCWECLLWTIPAWPQFSGLTLGPKSLPWKPSSLFFSSSADPKPYWSPSEPFACLLLLKLIVYQILDPVESAHICPSSVWSCRWRNTSNEQKSQTFLFEMHFQEVKTKQNQ